MTRPEEAPEAGPYHPDENETIGPNDYGELIFYLYDRQDRLYGRLSKKITRLEKRISALEERGRE